MQMATMKTSEEWLRLAHAKDAGLIILDPDGWDRKNFQYSWYEEKITEEEFRRRVFCSTVMRPIEEHNEA